MKKLFVIAALVALTACGQFDADGRRVIEERSHTALTSFGGSFDLGPCKESDTQGCGQGFVDGAAIKKDIATGNVVWAKKVDGGSFK